MTRSQACVALLVCLFVGPVARATPGQDALVQAPSIGSPQRGSLAGTMSRLAFGPGDLVRGAFALPLPIDVPTDRGPVLAKVTPTYSPETGIGEWGLGWQADLAIRRHRPLGEIDFIDDDFTSPWGRLGAGDDGSYYPAGLSTIIRVTPAGSGWVAQSGDGTRYTFDPVDAVTTPAGSYAWMLSRVETILGDTTTLSWIRNASGRPFLSTVVWGGRGDGTQYRMGLEYAQLATPFVSYVAGVKQLLDRRVSRVTVEVMSAGSYAVRYRYDLGYGNSPNGPGFYLQSLVKSYASGEAEPPVSYDYDLNVERLESAALEHAPGLDAFLSTYGSAGIQPDHATLVDLEQDGLVDLESNVDLQTARQTPSGFVTEALPPASGTSSLCRPPVSPFNVPRLLARMHGDAAEPQVVVTRTSGSQTRLLVCDRLGVPLHDENLAGNWQLGANTRIADIDQDQRPDIVRVGIGQVAVLRNRSASPDSLAFVPGPTTILSPAITPTASWILDMNGDGRADLVERTASAVVVWLGKGNASFESAGTAFGFVLANGQTLSGLNNFQFSFGDYNGDGLTDAILTQGQNVLVFTNRGGSFAQVAVPGLQGIPWTVSFPVIADLTGSGNEVAMFVNGRQAMALQLTSASTGLLRSADDGKGSRVDFSYQRIAPTAGVIRRSSTLTAITVTSSGYDPVTAEYEYGAPVLHSLGKYLVGFASVVKRSPALRETVAFINDDDVTGVLDHSETSDDRTPAIVRFDQKSYEDVRFHDVRWLRPMSMESGHRSTDGATVLSTLMEVSSYQREFCATATRTTGPSGVLVRTEVLAQIEGLADDLHCQWSAETQHGNHGDAALDFAYTIAVERNALGQVTQVAQRSGGVDHVLQTVDYGADHRVAAMTSPGRGTTLSGYDGVGRLVEVIDPVGSATRTQAFDPVSDAVVELERDRPDAASRFFYRYDGRERMRSAWDDISGASETLPTASIAYRDVTATQPGRIDVEALADEATGITRRSVDLVAADGAALVSGSWTGDQYALGTATISVRSDLRAAASYVGPRPESVVAALTSSDLRTLGLAAPLSDSTHAGFGHAITTTLQQQESVAGTSTIELILSSTELVTRVHQADGSVAETAVDAAGNLVRQTDETGIAHRYGYDALGRLVRVETPDGAQTLQLDDRGRPARVARDGVATTTYGYDETSGLLIHKEQLTPAGDLVQAADMSYDAFGRPTEITGTSPDDTSQITFDYDGQLGHGATVPGQQGQLTHVGGDGWSRTILVDALGRPYEQHAELTGWRDVTRDKTYRADGSVAADTLTVRGADGDTLLTTTKSTELDEAGRVGSFSVDDQVVYTLAYDAESRLARADFASGAALIFDYDPVTHRSRGYHLDAAVGSGGVTWERDVRGLVAAEVFDDEEVSTRRDYRYDRRGALVGAQTATESDSYAYGESGLPTTVTDAAGTRAVHRSGSALDVGGVRYVWDDAGRVVGKDDWTFSYGASGQLARAARAGRQIDFTYDDANQRLLKRVDGIPVRADVASGVLTEAGFVEPVTIQGITVGLLENGAFTPLLTDPRGTPFGGGGGIASPYGVRLAHTASSEFVDFAALGRDPDLAIVRMGVRDYDPTLGQFWTPDPLYLESLDKCRDSPLQCALYAYAGGNPVANVDPTGMDDSSPPLTEVTGGDRFTTNQGRPVTPQKVGNGTVTVRANVELNYNGVVPYAFGYDGPDANAAHWLQVLHFEQIVKDQKGKVHAVQGVRMPLPHDENVFGLTEGGTMDKDGKPRVDDYLTDAGLRGHNPYYDTVGLHRRTSTSLTMYDRPDPSDAAARYAIYHDHVKEFVERIHIDAFLILKDHVTYRIGLTRTFTFKPGPDPNRPDLDMNVEGAIRYEPKLSGPTSALPSTMAERMHKEFPDFDGLK